MIGGRYLVDLARQFLERLVELAKILRRLKIAQRLAQARNVLIELLQGRRAVRRSADLVHFAGQLLQCAPDLPKTVGRLAAAQGVAQPGDLLVELLQRRRILARGRHLIDLAGELLHGAADGQHVFGRVELAQRVAHLGDALFEQRELVAVDAELAAALDAGGERPDFFLQHLDGLPRHGVAERTADVGKVAAQREHRVIDAARAVETGNLLGDFAQLLFQPAEILGGFHRGERHRRGRLGRTFLVAIRCGVQFGCPIGTCARRAVAGDVGDNLVETAVELRQRLSDSGGQFTLLGAVRAFFGVRAARKARDPQAQFVEAVIDRSERLADRIRIVVLVVSVWSAPVPHRLKVDPSRRSGRPAGPGNRFRREQVGIRRDPPFVGSFHS